MNPVNRAQAEAALAAEPRCRFCQKPLAIVRIKPSTLDRISGINAEWYRLVCPASRFARLATAIIGTEGEHTARDLGPAAD